jgi:hypothetical protein
MWRRLLRAAGRSQVLDGSCVSLETLAVRASLRGLGGIMSRPNPTPVPGKLPIAHVQLQSEPEHSAVRWLLIHRNNAIELPRDRPFVVGRSVRCDVVLDAAIVSRTHCRLHVTARSVLVEDLKSSNGVFVNGERIVGPRDLLAGDRLAVGNDTMLLVSFEAPSLAEQRSRLGTIPDLNEEIEGPPSSTRHVLCSQEAEVETQKSDAFDTLGRLADRMLAQGRLDTAEKILTGHIFAVLGGERDTGKVPDEVIEGSTRYAFKLAAAQLDGAWVDLVLEYHLALRRPLSAESVEQVRALLAHRVQFDPAILARYKTVLRQAIGEGVLEDTEQVKTILGLDSPR